MCYSTKRI